MSETVVTKEQEPQEETRPVRQRYAFLTAIQFLTRVPVSSALPQPGELRDSPRYFPLVAILIGLMTTGLIWLGCFFWPVWLAVALAFVIEFRLTGGFHEDAVADVCDGFGGAWDRDRVLEIMKDSRIGTYGTLGLISAIGLRYAATLAVIEQAKVEQILLWGTAILAAETLGRWMIVLAMFFIPSIENRESLSRDIGSRMFLKDLLIATMTGLPILILFAILQPIRALISLVLLLLFVIWFRRLVLEKVGGLTGDCLGFLASTARIIVLLSVAVGGGTWTQLP